MAIKFHIMVITLYLHCILLYSWTHRLMRFGHLTSSEICYRAWEQQQIAYRWLSLWKLLIILVFIRQTRVDSSNWFMFWYFVWKGVSPFPRNRNNNTHLKNSHHVLPKNVIWNKSLFLFSSLSSSSCESGSFSNFISLTFALFALTVLVS